jgi:hypothetical protein
MAPRKPLFAPSVIDILGQNPALTNHLQKEIVLHEQETALTAAKKEPGRIESDPSIDLKESPSGSRVLGR